MIRFLNIVAMVAVIAGLTGCCSDAQPRFWKVRDANNGGTAYTVDTVAVAASSLLPIDIKYVNSAGEFVDVARPKRMGQLTEQEWKAATSGARYSLLYCGRRKACWAKTKAR